MGHTKLDFQAAEDIKEFQGKKRAQIYEAFNKSEGDEFATPITKAEFEEQFGEQFEKYSLQSVHKFRQEIMKSEIADKDGAFKDAVVGLKPYVVHNQGKKAIVFVRKREEVKE